MTGFNNQLIHESDTYNIPPNPMYVMDPNYANSLPLNQTILMDSDYASMNQPNNMNLNDIYSYQDPSTAFYQSPSQVSFSSGTGYFDSNNIYTGGSEQMNTTPYGYVESNNLPNYTSPPVYYPPPQTLVQTSSPPIFSNSAGIETNTRNHVHIVIITNTDIDLLERLLFIIHSRERTTM